MAEAGRVECGPERSLPDRCPAPGEGNVLLQLLEFKARLLELLEELHIRRDAEERFEEQINKLVLEKQELEWGQQSLQHQMETEKSRHSESLSQADKQFQAKITNLEDEKSRMVVSAEQKDKDIHNLKEELKALQLLKYNLEKKSGELEQKLALQTRSKDSHLNQLGEVEKRFCALSKQCNTVKQAHHKLQQNADEAMKLNKKLTTTNEKQEATIESLNKEVDELRVKLVKAKMSSVSHNSTDNNLSIKEETILQLQQKLDKEYDMNLKFKEENKALQAEKQEVLKSLEFAHELLSTQTQAVTRLELELQTQRQQHQRLESDLRTTQQKEKSAGEKIKILTEELDASKNNWDKEKEEFLEKMKNEQQELTTVKEAFEDLQHKHTELRSKANEQETRINELQCLASVKDVDVSVLSSSSAADGGSRDGDESELSNTEALTVAKDSDESKDNVPSIATGGQEDEQNGGSMSEILLEPHNNLLNLDNKEDINKNSSDMNGLPDLIMTSVPEDAAVSRAIESDSAHMNCSPAASQELDFSSTRVESGLQTEESAKECIKDEGASVTEKEKEENGEDAKEKSEDGAQENDKDIEMTGVSDDATDQTKVITENKNEDGKVEERGSIEAETTESAVDENQPQMTEDTENIMQLSPSKPTPGDEKVDPAAPIQEKTSPVAETPPGSGHYDSVKQTEESASDELPEAPNKSSLCQAQSDAAQLDGVTVKAQTQVAVPPDTAGQDKDSVDNSVDNSVKECSALTEDVACSQSQPEVPEQTFNSSDSVVKSLTNESEKKCENEQVDIKQVNVLDKSNFKCQQRVGLESAKQMGSQKDFMSVMKLSKTKDTRPWPSESDFKIHSFKFPEHPKSSLEKEAKMTDEFAAPFKTTFRSSFEWRKSQSYMTKADTSAHNSHVMTSQISPSNPKGFSAHAPVTLPTFLRGKRNKEPLTIMKTTDVFSSAASSWRLGEWTALGEAHRETAATESRVSQSDASSLVSNSSSKAEQLKRSPESDADLSCSQDTEEQQSSFRAQVSKIEQFLGTERLRLHKRKKTDI